MSQHCKTRFESMQESSSSSSANESMQVQIAIKDRMQKTRNRNEDKMCRFKLKPFILALILALAASQSLAANRSQEQQQSETRQLEPRAEALKQESATTTNVIIIKYANVTKLTGEQQESSSSNGDFTTAEEQQHLQTPLNIFKLYEPLSVAVIESKFAHSIQLFDVSHNQLSTLSKDLFCPLSNQVRQLNISHNLLENFDCLGLISQNGQLCLSELRILDMSYNLIKHLPATGVATLHNLEILNLSHNLIESLDELSLSSLFKLTKLDLSFNRIQQLPSRIFHKSNSMQVLKLQFNQLQTSISQTFLSGLISLEELNLSHNNISHVSDFAFLDKVNLTRVDLTHNQLVSLRQEAIRVTSVRQATGYRHRLHHNGQYAGVTPKQTHSQSASAEFLISSNPFTCDCHLEWLRNFQPSAIKRSVLSSSMLPTRKAVQPVTDHQDQNDQFGAQLMQLSSSNIYQNDQPSVILASTSDSSNNISEILSSSQQLAETSQSSRPSATLLSAQQQHVSLHHARIGDLDLIKCTPLFRRNTLRNHHPHERQRTIAGGLSRSQSPSDGHHTNHHSHHQSITLTKQEAMIDLVGADSSNFLCRYKSHCFALCHCCEFDACDCEMICPSGCNCYYNSNWQTNIIDCSSNNHTVVPDRIPMDVSGLYLDGNNIDSLKPSNLIARRALKTLYLNSTNLQYIANRTFNGLIELQTLYLNDNMLRSLNGYEFEPLAQLRALYLQSNRLDHISNQTFIYLRSLEILDLSNNRLTSTNLDLFWSIGHHNIRLRQLNIAHNWWSCQCSSINRFRQILKQKFLLNGGVNIADRNQLRCYYNSTTVGPLILAENPTTSVNFLSPQQPLFASFQSIGGVQRQQQTQLTEINQCSEIIEDQRDIDINPPLIQSIGSDFTLSNTPPNEFPNDPYSNQDSTLQSNSFNSQPPISDQPTIYPPIIVQSNDLISNQLGIGTGLGSQRGGLSSSSMPLTTFILLSVLLVGIMIIAVSILVFIRQQQRFNENHHKKSSAESTTSASSSASSTAISSLNGKSNRNQHLHQAHTLHPHHHLIMSNGSHGGATTTSIGHHLQQNYSHHHHHHHSTSSQSNIYAALVSPSTGNSTSVANTAAINNIPGSNIHNNLYSNSSTTASHHSSSSHGGTNGYPQHWQNLANQQSVYNQPYTGMGLTIENHYTLNAPSQASYKNGSLYNSPNNCHEGSPSLSATQASADWIKLPKVKQFMSKLVNKSLALGGYRACSRDELSTITSDKIYDAFISYDKRDEPFVMQNLSAELEYGQPQYRIADRFRDLPLPTSAYIAEAITSVIGCSHRTIIVLTENYLASEWCRYELQAALHEASLDKSHKIIAVVLDPKCLLEMNQEMRTLLTNSNATIYQQQSQQLVQLDNSSSELQQQQQLVATLTNQTGGNQQVCTQTAQLATNKITFINCNDSKFWQKIKQLMPAPRPSTQTLTLTTKN